MLQDCYSSNIPTSTVTYPDSSAFCVSNENVEYISNWVSLGILCNDLTSSDIHFECSDAHHDFVHLLNPNNLGGLRYLCIEGTLIDSNSLASNVQLIPNVSITTDEYWQSNAAATCYQQLSVDTPRPPVTIAVPVPSIAPIQATEHPGPGPTAAPEINTPISTPSVAPDISSPKTTPTLLPEIVAPVAAPLSPTSLVRQAPTIPTLTAPSKGDGNNNVLIFAAVGGVVGGIVVTVLLFMVYNKGKNDAVAEHKEEAFPTAKDQNDTDNNTESHHSPNLQQSSNENDSGSPTILSVAAMASPIEATPSDFYELHYKDQSRSVIATVNRRTQSGRRSNNDKTPNLPVLAKYHKADNVNNSKPASSVEIPTVPAIMCNDISMLGESDSAIRRLGDSNSSLRNLGQSNRSFRLTRASNSSIPTEWDTDKIYSNTKKEPPTSTLLANSNSSLQMVGEFNRSIHILDDSSSTIPTESATNSNNYDGKKPAVADSNSSFRLVDESNRSFHALEDSNSTIPTQSNTFSNNYNREKPEDSSNGSLRMAGDANRPVQNLEDSNSTIRTESNTESNDSYRKKPAYPSSALEL